MHAQFQFSPFISNTDMNKILSTVWNQIFLSENKRIKLEYLIFSIKVIIDFFYHRLSFKLDMNMLDIRPKKLGISTDIKIYDFEVTISHHVWVALISISFLEYAPCLPLISMLPPEF